jgi:Nickel responsive protein SCO4226-like
VRRGRRTFVGEMPRYIVERRLAEGWPIPLDDCAGVLARNAADGVTWIESYVSEDRSTAFCVYDAPTPEAIRKTALRNDLPVDRITQVRVLDPYFYR